MRQYVLYGLDRDGRVVLTEHFAASTVEDARTMARQRLDSLAHVEVWDGPICVFRDRPKRTP